MNTAIENMKGWSSQYDSQTALKYRECISGFLSFNLDANLRQGLQEVLGRKEGFDNVWF